MELIKLVQLAFWRLLAQWHTDSAHRESNTRLKAEASKSAVVHLEAYLGIRRSTLTQDERHQKRTGSQPELANIRTPWDRRFNATHCEFPVHSMLLLAANIHCCRPLLSEQAAFQAQRLVALFHAPRTQRSRRARSPLLTTRLRHLSVSRAVVTSASQRVSC